MSCSISRPTAVIVYTCRGGLTSRSSALRVTAPASTNRRNAGYSELFDNVRPVDASTTFRRSYPCIGSRASRDNSKISIHIYVTVT